MNILIIYLIGAAIGFCIGWWWEEIKNECE